MLGRIANMLGFAKPVAERPSGELKLREAYQAVRALKAKYDAAQTTDDNLRHWQWSDDLSAIAANNPAVRRVLRKRSRYEVANNCYARGLTLTLANDCIGTGPRLQMLTPNKDANRQIERAFNQWARAVGLASKLRTMRMAKVQDGEAFAVLTNNPRLRSPVKLDLRVVEADRVATPFGMVTQETASSVDGIKFDRFGNPSTYTILRTHPGEASLGGPADADDLPADVVIHWFRADRPGQARAVPEITAALPLFAMLRDFKIATLDAAKAAAAVSFILKTAANANTGEAESPTAWETIEFVRNMGMTLPEGSDISQFKSEHPNSNIQMFEDVILREIGRCLNCPKAVITGDSSSYNFASGRMDGQIYWKSVEVERRDCESVVVDRIFDAWLDEGLLVQGVLPAGMGAFDADHQWFWDGREHVDPTKNANAAAINIAAGISHRALEYAQAGRDIDSEDAIAAEGFGMTVEEYRQRLADHLLGPDALALAQERAKQMEQQDEQDADQEESNAEAA